MVYLGSKALSVRRMQKIISFAYFRDLPNENDSNKPRRLIVTCWITQLFHLVTVECNRSFHDCDKQWLSLQMSLQWPVPKVIQVHATVETENIYGNACPTVFKNRKNWGRVPQACGKHKICASLGGLQHVPERRVVSESYGKMGLKYAIFLYSEKCSFSRECSAGTSADSS